eukprot:1184548-Prorocentrum_minimum.AAC.5
MPLISGSRTLTSNSRLAAPVSSEISLSSKLYCGCSMSVLPGASCASKLALSTGGSVSASPVAVCVPVALLSLVDSS